MRHADLANTIIILMVITETKIVMIIIIMMITIAIMIININILIMVICIFIIAMFNALLIKPETTPKINLQIICASFFCSLSVCFLYNILAFISRVKGS